MAIILYQSSKTELYLKKKEQRKYHILQNLTVSSTHNSFFTITDDKWMRLDLKNYHLFCNQLSKNIYKDYSVIEKWQLPFGCKYDKNFRRKNRDALFI